MMQARASATDQRRATRHQTDYRVVVEHLGRGPLTVHIANISEHGFIIDRAAPVVPADRLVIPLPVVGRLEGHCIWTSDERAGFQFERIIRADIFATMLDEMRNIQTRSRAGI